MGNKKNNCSGYVSEAARTLANKNSTKEQKSNAAKILNIHKQNYHKGK